MIFLKKIRGSALVEKIMIVVFSLVVGSAVISFLIGQVKKAQNVEVDVSLINENLEDNVDDDPVGFQELAGSQFHYHYFTDPNVPRNLYGWSFIGNSDAKIQGYMFIFMDDPDSLNFYNTFVEFAKDPNVDLGDGIFYIFIVEENISEYRKEIRKQNYGFLSEIFFDSSTYILVSVEYDSTMTKQDFLDKYEETFSGFQELEGPFYYYYIEDYDVQNDFEDVCAYCYIREWSRDKKGYMFIFMDDPDSLNFYNAFVEFATDPNVDLDDGFIDIYVVKEKFSEHRERIREVNEGYLAEIFFSNSYMKRSKKIEVDYEFDNTITKQTFLDAYEEVFG